MVTMPLFRKRVDISTKIRKSSIDFIASAFIHEASHKCWTNDLKYFWQSRENPNEAEFLDWQSTASTHDWWILFGFCVPGYDCRDPAKW